MTPEERLSNAIVQQAANDYKKVLQGRENSEFNKHELEKFFRSQWIEELTPCNGEYLMRLLREDEERKKKSMKEKDINSYISLQYEAKMQKGA